MLTKEIWKKPKETPFEFPPDAPKWRGRALAHYTFYKEPYPKYSIARRVTDISRSCFQTQKRCTGYFSSDEEDIDEDEAHVEWLMDLLDELEAYDGESIDVAELLDLRKMLSSFLVDVLSNKHACVRAKAAQLVTSMVQNHPTSQQLIIQGNGIQLLLHNFTTDLDATSRTKALAAISSLIWNNKSGITVFLQEDGYKALRNALNLGSVLAGPSIHNEVENLIGYLRRESNLYLEFGHDSEVQEAAGKGGNSGQLGKNDDKQKQNTSKKRRRNYSSLNRLKLKLKLFNKHYRSSSSSSSKRMKLH